MHLEHAGERPFSLTWHFIKLVVGLFGPDFCSRVLNMFRNAMPRLIHIYDNFFCIWTYRNLWHISVFTTCSKHICMVLLGVMEGGTRLVVVLAQVKVIHWPLRAIEVSFSSFSNITEFLFSGVFCIPNVIPRQSPRNCFVPQGVTIASWSYLIMDPTSLTMGACKNHLRLLVKHLFTRISRV